MQTINERFAVDQSWGPYEGELSSVVRAVDLKNGLAKVAIKIFDKDAFQQGIVTEAFHRECESLQKLSSHENIVALIDIGRDPVTGCSYVALDWYDSNLFDHLQQHPEPTWAGFHRRYGRNILDALCFAYSQDVIHRDIKPQNILIDANGRARVTDFGISKFRRYYRPGVTLAHFKSVPYAPPEDYEDYPDTRDVFSFAVLCIECIGGFAFTGYEEVYQAVDRAELPRDISAILGRCLSPDPSMRPANVVLLAEEIESVMARQATLESITRDIPIHLTNSATDAMRVEGHHDTLGQAATQIMRELNEICGVDEQSNTETDGERHVALLTAEFRFRAVIDQSRNALTIIATARQNPSRLERLREASWQPQINFIRAGHRGDEKAMDWFETEFDEFLTQRRVRAEQKESTELFDRWSAILRAKEGIQDLLKEPIAFTASRHDGARLYLAARHHHGDTISLQQRTIQLDRKSAIYGEIERTDGEEIVLYCGYGQDLAAVPKAGTLELDVRQSQIALKRQIGALDAVKFGRNARPDLRDILTGKKPPDVPNPPQGVTFFQADLDEDKLNAVCAALGTNDLLIVEGPPGTGKTKFITELVAQVLSRAPNARILLSSQTNVALDHALVNIEKLTKRCGLGLRAVRIGRRDDEKVSPELSHLLLDRCVSSWLDAATQQSERFLLNWATQHEITSDNVLIGMALADLRKSSGRMLSVQEAISELRLELEELQEERREIAKDRSKGDEFRTVVADIRLKQAELSHAEESLDAARQAFQAANDKAKGFPDLAGQIESLSEKDLVELEADFINHSSHGPQFRKLLLLAEEWRQRFGQSSDFHGAFIADCDLIAGTCLGVAGHSLQSVEFDLCIIDEASKATPTEMLVPMAKSKKWIVVGDPNQLPPFVDGSLSARLELEKQGIGKDEVRRTLLDHFIDIAPAASQVSLLTQHRMIRPIGELVSFCFYGGTLKNVNTKSCPLLAKSLALPKPVTWLNTAGSSNRLETFHRGTYVNDAEVEAISNLLLRLQLAASKRDSKYSVALLSGYGGQVAALDRLAASKRRQLSDLDVETGTVDSYQGREADIAIYSITRSNPERKIGFLREHERLNVALSRGKIGLVIVGDSVFCDNVHGQNPFADVLSYMRSHPDDCAFVDVA
jgi:serine/threonine protein kinase